MSRKGRNTTSLGNKIPAQNLRRKILIEQMGRCAYCNAGLDDETLEWDHFIPFSYLGCNPQNNWVAACRACNRTKSSRVFSSEADLTDFIVEMVTGHGSFGDGWPEGAYFKDLRHSGADLELDSEAVEIEESQTLNP